MSRRYVPDLDAVVTVLAGRVDTIERRVRAVDEWLVDLAGDVAALGRGITDLTAQIRLLTSARSSTSPSSAPGSLGDGHEPAGGGERDEDGADRAELVPQRDWVAIDDPALAGLWLEELAASNAYVLAQHGAAPGTPCWPLHPDVVAELLALQAERDTAYDGERPTPVSEWLARWLPTAAHRIHTSLASCEADRGHHEAGHLWDARVLDLASVAGWWTEHRDTPAHQALDLPRLD